MKVRRQPQSLLDLAAVQERTADILAEAVHEAERAGRMNAAKSLWTLMHRCRVHAEALRAQAADRRCGPAD
jgi:hypothetical protein